MHGMVLAVIATRRRAVVEASVAAPVFGVEVEPHASRRIESDDLDPDAVSEVPEQVFRDPVRSIRILDHEGRRLVPFFLPQRLDVPVREGLGTGGTARLQDWRKPPEELDPRGSGLPDAGKG